MIAVIQRYKPYLIAVTLIILGLMTWLIISKINAEKIPSKGVFVMEKVID